MWGRIQPDAFAKLVLFGDSPQLIECGSDPHSCKRFFFGYACSSERVS